MEGYASCASLLWRAPLPGAGELLVQAGENGLVHSQEFRELLIKHNLVKHKIM